MCKVIKIGLISERAVTSVDCQDDRDSAAAGHPEGAQWLGDPDHHQPQVPGHDPLLLQGQVPHRLEAQQGRGRQLRRAAEEASWTRVSFHHHIQLVFCKFKILCMVNETQVKRFPVKSGRLPNNQVLQSGFSIPGTSCPTWFCPPTGTSPCLAPGTRTSVCGI